MPECYGTRAITNRYGDFTILFPRSHSIALAPAPETIRTVRRCKQTRAYLTRPPCLFSFPQTTITTYFPPTRRRLTTTAMIVDAAAQLSTLYAISFMPFTLLIVFSSRRGFTRKRFSPSAIFKTCELFNSPCSLIWYVSVTVSLELKLICAMVS